MGKNLKSAYIPVIIPTPWPCPRVGIYKYTKSLAEVLPHYPQPQSDLSQLRRAHEHCQLIRVDHIGCFLFV